MTSHSVIATTNEQIRVVTRHHNLQLQLQFSYPRNRQDLPATVVIIGVSLPVLNAVLRLPGSQALNFAILTKSS